MTSTAPETKCRPILFGPAMVKAILAGEKTQTRRVINPQPYYNPGTVKNNGNAVARLEFNHSSGLWSPTAADGYHYRVEGIECPYGVPGDLLYVKEPWQAWTEYDKLPPRDVPDTSWINYTADGNLWDSRKRNARFMCRWMSRLTLRVTDVRVERLQDISEADARAEGGTPDRPFGTVWRKINMTSPLRWEDNPWVWAITFERTDDVAGLQQREEVRRGE